MNIKPIRNLIRNCVPMKKEELRVLIFSKEWIQGYVKDMQHDQEECMADYTADITYWKCFLSEHPELVYVPPWRRNK